MQDKNWKYVRTPVKESQINETEKVISLKLPKDYKSFVCTYNGARPISNAVELPSGIELVFERLLHIEADSKSNSVLGYLEVLKKRGHNDLIPFGADPFGNLFCFRLSGQNTKEIVFWNHEKDSTSKICESFSNLLDLLHPAKI